MILVIAVLAQTLQYQSPAGVSYQSLPDTGAVARAESALAGNPRSVELLTRLGLAQIGIRRYREAIETFSRAISIEPDNALLYRHRGHRYLSVRELDRALADLERGLRLDSTMYGVLYHLGIVRFLRGDFNGAAELFRRATPLAPDPGELGGSYDWTWMSLARAGRSAEAAGWLRQIRDSTTNTGYWQRLRLYRGLIGPDDVIATAGDTRGIAIATLAFGLGNWHLVRGDSAAARAAFRRSVSVADGWPAFGFIAAEAELQRNR
jgi:tetratricopeptide (TPR) repeat protein